MATRGIIRLLAKVRELFPPQDPLVPSLMRVMAAANDLGVLMRLFMHSSSRKAETESERKIIEAENVYLFRITCATVYEAALVFLDFESKVRETERVQATELVRSLEQRGREAFLFLENLFCHDIRKFEKTQYGKILVQSRNHSFHYDTAENFREALQAHDEVGELLIGQIAGVSRYLLADDLQVQIILRPISIELKTPTENLRGHAFVETTARVTAALTNSVDAWVGLYLYKHPEAMLERVEDKVQEESLWIINA